MNTDLSILQLVLGASWVVQAVMLLLVGVSIASWAAIFGKLFGLKRVRTMNEEFEREFWAGRNLNELYGDAAKRTDASPMRRSATAGRHASTTCSMSPSR